jgi:acyl-CoA thioester hydrolase
MNEFSISRNIIIRGYDIDYGGVVSNIVYIRWLDDLRTELLSGIYSIEQMQKDGIAPVVNKTAAHYKRPLFFGDSAIAKITVNSMEKVRWTVETEIRRDAQLCFRAEQSGGFINLSKGALTKIPDRIMEKWNLRQVT